MEEIEQIWQRLHAQRQQDIGALFAADGERFQGFSARLDDLLLDFSKTSISREALQLLLQLAQAAGVAGARDAMFAGEKINSSEGRAVLHTALRASGSRKIMLDGKDIMAAVASARADMLDYADGCRSGAITAADGKPYTEVINIGVGGSGLGPAMAVAALAPYGAGLRLHFVANLDGADLADTLAPLAAARTLVIISSKSFTTAETMANAAAARRWLAKTLGEDAASRQLVAVTSAAARAQSFGVCRVFPTWDWVGGRYSLWGQVGLPIALAIGRQRFEEFLSGAAAMDAHFCSAPPPANLPLLLGLVGVWHRNVCGYQTRLMLPYDQRLQRLPTYLQQLQMESNGKAVLKDNTAAAQATAPVVWGSVGSSAQHAYFQMLHQGCDVVPGEFIVAALPVAADERQHQLLLASCLAQTAALMRGGAAAEGAQQLAGNRPSVTLIYRQLTPYALGRLIALYEHRTFVEGVIWGINPFDQWGVEWGKTLAQQLSPLVAAASAECGGQDASTQGLLAHYHGIDDIDQK